MTTEVLDPMTAPEAAAPSEIVFTEATLLTAPGSAGSASGGAKGTLKFEVHTAELGALLQLGIAGQSAVRVKWDKYDFGELSIAAWSGRPDEDGSPRSYLAFAVSQTVIPYLAPIYAKILFGKTARLVLNPQQVSMEDVLAKRA